MITQCICNKYDETIHIANNIKYQKRMRNIIKQFEGDAHIWYDINE